MTSTLADHRPGSLIIGVDFDGTIVEHKFPDIGKPVPGAIETLRECQRRGARLVLWTMRSDSESEPYLAHAVAFLHENGIEPWGVNANPETNWTSSPKAYCHVYIDDSALGCPLMPATTTRRPMVDWSRVRPELLSLVDGRAVQS